MPPLFEQSATSDTTPHQSACDHTRLESINGSQDGESADLSSIDQQRIGLPVSTDRSELGDIRAVQTAASETAIATQEWYNYVLEFTRTNRPCKDDPDLGLFNMLPDDVRFKIWKLAFGLAAVIEIPLAKGSSIPSYYLCGCSASLLRVNARLHDECAPFFFREAIRLAASRPFWEGKSRGRRGYYLLLPRERRHIRR